MVWLARRLFPIVLTLLVVVLLWNWLGRQRWTRHDVRDAIVTTLQSEAPANFFVTGELEVTVTVTSSDRKFLATIPFTLDLGTTEATVRVPGKVAYGFDLSDLRSDDIHIEEGETVEVALPELAIYSVDPDMSRIEMYTRVGWGRTQAGSGNEQEQAALAQVRDALRMQGERHLRDSDQPRTNTARAVDVLLRPVLTSMGMTNPKIHVHIGRELVRDSAG